MNLVAPAIVKNGLAFGVQPYPDTFPEIWSYAGLSFSNPDAYADHPSPRYWLLWPGVLMMLLYSFADVMFSLLPAMKSLRANRSSFSFDLNAIRKSFTHKTELDDDDEDRTPMEDRIPFSWWGTGVFASTVMSCAILATKFNMNVGEALLALILGFFFSFIGVQSSGQTDINPVSTVAKVSTPIGSRLLTQLIHRTQASQLIFGGIAKGSGMATNAAMTFNLSAGVVSAGSAAQASDMTGDLKTGYLLGAKPKNQFIAQLIGSIVAVFLNTGLFILFTKASPCILVLPDDGTGLFSWCANDCS